MKSLFKNTKVIYDAHLKTYDVYYKNFLFWKFDQSYKVSEYMKDEVAKTHAIERAKNMLLTIEIFHS